MQTSVAGVGLLSVAPLLKAPFGRLFAIRGQDRYSLSEYLKDFPEDKVDTKIDYLRGSQEALPWQAHVGRFFEEVLFKLPVPVRGSIVEFGTYDCVSFERLCAKYSASRCVGYDIYEYKPHHRQIITDIRTLSAKDDQPVAFGWSNASMWMSSPRSKKAAYNYLMRNVVVGGYLLEDAIRRIPNDITFPGFVSVYSDKQLLLMKRVS